VAVGLLFYTAATDLSRVDKRADRNPRRPAALFPVILTVFALLHTFAAKFGWVRAQHLNGRIRNPFAPSVAAGLIGTSCLAPA
jgi:hypothetical protein